MNFGYRLPPLCVCSHSDRFYTFGGSKDETYQRFGVMRFDTQTERASYCGLLPLQVTHSVTVASQGRILVIGGILADNSQSPFCLEYTPETNGLEFWSLDILSSSL